MMAAKNPQARVAGEEDHGSDESEMPIVPKVDIDGAGCLGQEHQEIDAEADGNNEGSDGSVVGHGGSGRPAHVEYLQLKVVDFHDSVKSRRAEVSRAVTIESPMKPTPTLRPDFRASPNLMPMQRPSMVNMT